MSIILTVAYSHSIGCHVMALDLVRTWSFQRPSLIVPDRKPKANPEPSSPISTRLTLEPALRHRASVFIDMDPVTRPASPAPNAVDASARSPHGQPKEEGDALTRKAGLGILMKTAKQNVSVPEFDMGAFF